MHVDAYDPLYKWDYINASNSVAVLAVVTFKPAAKSEIMQLFKQKGKGRAKPTTIRLLCWILEASRSPLLIDIPNDEIVGELKKLIKAQVTMLSGEYTDLVVWKVSRLHLHSFSVPADRFLGS